MTQKFPRQQIVYFDHEGNENLPEVVRVIKNGLKRRAELRSLKLVIFTAEGQGPWLAYNQLNDFDLQIIAVTFPVDFSVKRGDSRLFPRIPLKVMKFFNGVGITVVSPAPLAFDSIEGLDQRNQQLKAVKDAISIFGGGFNLCIQAVIRACDADAIKIGERVIAMAGDCAAIITASTTAKFLAPGEGITIHEILCKARNLTIARPKAAKFPEDTQGVLPVIEGQMSNAVPVESDQAITLVPQKQKGSDQ